jgi:hypothetical protein
MPDDDEDDYLTMDFTEPSGSKAPETYSERRARKLREHQSKMEIISPKVLEVERRETSLATSIMHDTDSKNSKAMRMMKMMGYV